MTNKQGFFEEPDPRTGKAPKHQAAAAKTKKIDNKFKVSDFTISPLFEIGDNRVAYIFESRNVLANLYWEVGKEPELRGLVGDKGTIEIRYPIAVKSGDKVYNPREVLSSLVKRLNRGNYDKGDK